MMGDTPRYTLFPTPTLFRAGGGPTGREQGGVHPPRPAAADPARSRIVRDGIGVGLATGAYGISFGALGIAAGLDVWQTCALSLLMFTGASQFAFVGVIASGGAPLSGAVTAVLLGVRNALYGMKLSGTLGYRGWRRTAAAQLVIDESTAMRSEERRVGKECRSRWS